MAKAAESVALIGVDEALIRLTAAVSDEQAATQRANLDQDSAPKFKPPTPEIAELLRQAPLHRMRHEAAIALLDAACSCGDQRPVLRTPGGDLILLTSAEWAAYPFRRQTLISGVWRGSAGPAGLLEYDQFPVLLVEAAFRSWCERVAPASGSPTLESESPRYELKERPHKVSNLVWVTMQILVELRNENPELYPVLKQNQLVAFVNGHCELRGAQAGVPVSRIELRTLQTAVAELKRSVPGWT